MIEIKPFEPVHQPGVDALLESIAPEYAEPFFNREGKKMQDMYLLPGRFYWVALSGGVVVGTVGVIAAEDHAVLKSLFISRSFRGKELAYMLLDMAHTKARAGNIPVIYLGTMAQFIAAQKFYEKHGYKRIDAHQLPAAIAPNEFDTVFYKKYLP